MATEREVVEVVSRDCGYGFSAFARMSDGTTDFHTASLYATRDEAEAEVASLIAEAR